MIIKTLNIIFLYSLQTKKICPIPPPLNNNLYIITKYCTYKKYNTIYNNKNYPSYLLTAAATSAQGIETGPTLNAKRSSTGCSNSIIGCISILTDFLELEKT